MQENHAQQLPWHIISLDTETQSMSSPDDDVQTHSLVLGSMVYRRYWVSKDKVHKSRIFKYRFDTVDELIELLKPIVLRAKRRTYLYAHNANFDYGIINLRYVFKQLDLETQCYINEKPPVIVIGKKGTSTLICLDTLNMFPFPLDTLAKAMGFAGKSELPDVEDADALYRYCERDTLLLSSILDAWRRFIQIHEMGNYKYTIASQSMTSFRHGYLPKKTVIQTKQEWILQQERKCYLGGRVEAFRLGRIEEPVYLVDVNSMYPYVMQHNHYPTRFRIYRKDTEPFGYQFPSNVRPGMATISATLTAPVLPHILQQRLCFPVGEIHGTWAWSDIQTALPFLRDVQWHEFWAYEYRSLFRNWVSTQENSDSD